MRLFYPQSFVQMEIRLTLDGGMVEEWLDQQHL